jgi:DNA-binding MarR family transcriptional regulator
MLGAFGEVSRGAWCPLTLSAASGLLLHITTDVKSNEKGSFVAERQSVRDTSDGGGEQPLADRNRTRGKRRTLSLGVLDGHLGYFVRRLQVWIFHDFARALASFNIRPAQFSVLVVIEANPGLSQADLAERLGIERARLVRLLDGLEKRGLTRRQASPRDRRSHALILTREGQKSLKRMKLLAAEHEANLTRRLGPEKRAAVLAALRELA